MRLKNFIFSGLVLVLLACNSTTEESSGIQVYTCDAENRIEQEGGALVFNEGGTIFKSAETQTAEFVFAGEHSLKLDGAHPYGFSFILEDVKKGEFFNATVWEKDSLSNGALIAVASGGPNFVLSSSEGGYFEMERGWRKHQLQFKAITDLDSLTFFVFAGGSGAVTYFDGLRVERYEKRPMPVDGHSEIVKLSFPDSSRQKIDTIIAAAVQEEIIRDDFKKYVNANWIVDEDTIPVEIRLKGDWTDHLISGSVSYRIKTEDDFAYKGLTSFSIQHPKTRSYMHEWFMHEWFEREGLLSTRYDFLEVLVDDNYEGIYALEEHFDKQLLESRNRREGPLLKMDETGFWALAVKARVMGLESLKAPFYQAAIQSCFKENRTLKSPNLFGQFNNGAKLLNHFKAGYEHAEDLFDMEQLGTYYALMDMGNVRHAMAWHNRRFYYNPVTTKLEHIGFDMAPMVRPLNKLMATEQFNSKTDSLDPEACLNYRIFQNEEFRKVYLEKLRLFSSIDFLDVLFADLDSAISVNENLMAIEQEGFKFDRAIYYEKAALIRNELKTLEANWDLFIENSQSENLPVNGKEGEYDLGDSKFYLKDISVNAYRSKIDSATFKIELENFHFANVKVLGYSVKKAKDSLIRFEEPIILNGYTGGAGPDTASIIIENKPSRLLFEVANLPGLIKTKKFIKWEKPKGEHPRIALKNAFSTSSPFYTVTGNSVEFNTGTYQINRLLYIPSGYQVNFKAGTTIDFIEQGGLILNDRTKMNGEEGLPIRFTSSDKTGMGITILQADSVIVNHVEVEQMNTLNYGGWVLTGAFTIYESEVMINGLTIRDNNCEDGLNVIRSHFQIQNCLIERTKSDGFDADFCTGTFSDAEFRNTGNDCIDFSGSIVNISRIDIKNSGDKGISAGERSTLTVNDIHINGALTGLASKDGSVLIGSNIWVNGAEVGIAAFQKKPEYGSSQLLLTAVHYEDLNRLGLIEKGSTATIDGKVHSGYQKFDIDRMYARFGEK